VTEFYIRFRSVNKKNCTLEFSFVKFCDVTHDDNCPQEEEFSHIWLYRSEKKVNFFKESHTIYWWPVLCFWGPNFLATWLGKVGMYKRYKGVFCLGKIEPKSSYYDKDNLKSRYLESRFNKSSNYMRNK
jgi:hypothetical protein